MSRISRKELKRDEFVEATKEAEHWLEDNWQLVAKIAAGIAVVGVLVAIGFWVVKSNREKAAALFAEGLGQYQQAQAAGFDDPAQIEAALITFDASAKKGGGSVGQVANYYRGVSLHRLGRNEDAIVALLEVSGSESASPTLAGSAKALLAEVYQETGETDRAVEMLQSLIDTDPPIYPVDQALLELGKIRMARGENDQARQDWQRIVDEFPARGAVDEARTLLGS
jgi:tetratricopeptide (TPR) repeat protein